jgi:hypothetical protein
VSSVVKQFELSLYVELDSLPLIYRVGLSSSPLQLAIELHHEIFTQLRLEFRGHLHCPTCSVERGNRPTPSSNLS